MTRLMVLLLALMPVLLPNAPAETVHFLNGDKLQGNLRGFDPAPGIEWEQPALGQTLMLKPAALDRIEFPAGEPPATQHQFLIRTRTGATLRADLVEADESKLVVDTWYAGQLTLARAQIALLSAGATDVKSLAPGSNDVVVLVSGEKVSGSIQSVRAGTLHFQSAYGALQIPLTAVVNLALGTAPAEAKPSPSGEVEVNLGELGRLRLTWEGWRDGKLLGRTDTTGSLAISHAALRSIRFTPTQALRVRIFMDGRDSIHIKGDKFWFVHESWRVPGDGDESKEQTFINGTGWSPQWTDKLSNTFTLDPPFPQAGVINAQMTIGKARGVVQITQQPQAANQYEAVILVDDADVPGQDWYEFQLSW